MESEMPPELQDRESSVSTRGAKISRVKSNSSARKQLKASASNTEKTSEGDNKPVAIADGSDPMRYWHDSRKNYLWIAKLLCDWAETQVIEKRETDVIDAIRISRAFIEEWMLAFTVWTAIRESATRRLTGPGGILEKMAFKMPSSTFYKFLHSIGLSQSGGDIDSLRRCTNWDAVLEVCPRLVTDGKEIVRLYEQVIGPIHHADAQSKKKPASKRPPR
jgi:hypothetical protein